jgi:hypothetical protein
VAGGWGDKPGPKGNEKIPGRKDRYVRINKGIVAWAVTAMVAVVPAQMAFANGLDLKKHHKHEDKKHYEQKHHKHHDHKHHHKHHKGFHGGDHSQNHNDFSRDNYGRCQTAEEGGLIGGGVLKDGVRVITVDPRVCNGDDLVQVGGDEENS